MKNKRIVYNYLFNYFGGDKWNGSIVGGASIDLEFHIYKDGKEVLFGEDEEPSIGDSFFV